MAALELIGNHDFGYIYVIGNPKLTHNLRWFAQMIAPMIRPLSVKWIHTWEVDHTLITARRFNVGNMGKYATVQLHLNPYGRSDSFSLLAALHAFSDCLQDVMDPSEGDVIINESDYNNRNEPLHGKWGASTSAMSLGDVFEDYSMHEMQQDHTRVSPPPYLEIDEACLPHTVSSPAPDDDEPTLGKRVKKVGKKLSKSLKRSTRHATVHEFTLDMEHAESQSMVLRHDDFEIEEVLEFKRIEEEYERDVRDLRARIVAFIAKYHQDPQQVIATMLEGKVLLGPTPGRLLVNGDMKIVLPDYDEMEIKMPAMCRTLYILFLKQRLHDSGIVLKNINDYRDDLINIYSMVKPGAHEQRVQQTVDNLCNPLSESLNQMISRINRCVRNVITDKDLVQQYIISGVRGEEYSVGITAEQVTLPRAVTRD